jgi:hypothetical protein
MDDARDVLEAERRQALARLAALRDLQSVAA